MTNMVNSGNVYGWAGHWLIGTAKRNPEALLVLVAGCALLMRGGAGPSQAGLDQDKKSDEAEQHRHHHPHACLYPVFDLPREFRLR